MSPTILAMLQAVERKCQRDASAGFFDDLDRGSTARRAHFYNARTNWPDARTLVRKDLRYRHADGSRVATFYGSSALASVGL